MKKYVLYLNVDEKLELKGRTITTSNHITTSVDEFYRNVVRAKVTQELLEPEDKLLILTTNGETRIQVLE